MFEKKDYFEIIKRLIFIVITLIIILSIFDKLYFSAITSKKQLYRTEQEYLSLVNNTARSLKYINFGDSHAKNAINPRFIDDYFNFASGAQDYIVAYLHLKKILYHDNVSVDNVIIEIDPHSLTDALYPKDYQIKDVWFWYQSGLIREVKLLNDYDSVELFIKSHLYSASGGENLRLFFVPPPLSDTYRGWIDPLTNFSDEKDLRKATENYFKATFVNNKTQVNLVGSQYLKKLVFLANSSGSNIIFIRYPLSTQYQSYMGEVGFNITDYYNNVFTLINSTGVPYKFLDYKDAFTNISFFADPGHVNPVGAEIISKRLVDDINNSKIIVPQPRA